MKKLLKKFKEQKIFRQQEETKRLTTWKNELETKLESYKRDLKYVETAETKELLTKEIEKLEMYRKAINNTLEKSAV